MRALEAVYGFAESWSTAAALAAELGVPCHAVECHRFPDGESRIRLDVVARNSIVYRSLDQPNDKLIELLLAVSVLRANNLERPTLVAPYLPYMRQDRAFRPGEAIAQQVIGRILGAEFARIVTVDPHLHRTTSLADVMPGTVATVLSAAPILAGLVDRQGSAPILVGPDSESETLVSATARMAGANYLVLRKSRRGDRSVEIVVPDRVSVAGRFAMLVDDMISTGGTVIAAAKALQGAGCARIEALTTHALFDEEAARAMAAAGIARIRSTDAVPHPTNSASLVSLLAASAKQV